MIVVKIHYGLGNQLFQYAFAKSLAVSRGVQVGLDRSFYDSVKDNNREFALSKFNISLPIVESEKVFDTGLVGRFGAKVRRVLLPYYRQPIVYEKSLSFDPRVYNVNDGAYLAGYWQDERYFCDIAALIREDLRFLDPPLARNDFLFQQIQSDSKSVCVHIRRGDYVTDQDVLQNVGVSPLSFYEQAVDLVLSKIIIPSIYVFSDEPEWVRANFRIKSDFTVVDNNSERDAIEDLKLMVACKHHIISNSSFGWWAAWLNMNSEKIVIAPKVWRRNGPDMYTGSTWFRI